MKQDLKTVMKAIFDFKFNGGREVEVKHGDVKNCGVKNENI